MTVLVERMITDLPGEIESAAKRLKEAMLSTLGVSVEIKLVGSKRLPRSEGKAVRVVDKREI